MLNKLEISGSLDSLKLWHQVLPSDNSASTIAGVLTTQRDHAGLEFLAQTEELSSTIPELYAVVKRYAAAQQQGGWNSNATDIAYLEALAAQREPIGSALAYGWLEALGHPVPEEIILHPEDTPKLLRNEHRQTVEWPSNPQIEAFPNPSNGPVFVGYDIPEGTAHAELRVLDLSGREIFVTFLGQGVGLSMMETTTWANGMYIAELRLDGKATASAKISIQR